MFAQLRSAYVDGDAQLRIAYEEESEVAPTITTTGLPNGYIGTYYNQTIQYTGSTSTFAVTSGTLPAGLSLSSAGVITGYPTTPVNASFTITATNGTGSDPQALTLLIPNEGDGETVSVVTTITAVPATTGVGNQETTDCVVTVEDQDGLPIVNIDGIVVSDDEATATGVILAPTDSNGETTMRITGEATGSTSVYAVFDNVYSNAVEVTVSPATVTGEASITLDDMSGTLTGNVSAIIDVEGTASITFDEMSLTATGTGLISIEGEASIELNRMRVASTGVVGVDVGSASNYSVGGRYVSKPFYE